ncbi:MAG: cytochrome c biogenesis CcdA family protein [Patescibacteria group bacterium]
MELLLSASIVAAFIAGVAALFAPCCITVLLPSYFASIFRERHKIFLMTFIFFLGILTVFLPIGLGAAALGQIFSRYHNTIFAIGGIFLIILGVILLTGQHFSMPFRMNSSLKKHNALSVFSLGIFSGIATTCCAPVLAGVLTLAALPASLFWGAAYTLSYVLGMVAPLFLISLFLDKANFSQKLGQTFRKPIEYSIGGKKVNITLAEVISGVTFFIMGVFIIYLASTNRLFVHSGYQTMLNIYLTKFMDTVGGFVKIIPEYVWATILIIIIIYLIKYVSKQFKKEKYEERN